MKKLFIVALMLIITGGSFANRSQQVIDGQTADLSSRTLPVMFTDRKEIDEYILYWSALERRVAFGDLIPDAKIVKGRALSDFQMRFVDASEVKWFSDNNGYTSYFTKDGFNNRAFYNKNGRWLFSVLYQKEDKLPKDIRA